MKADYLTQEDLLNTLEHEGFDVPERTLRFWVAKGILEPPLRKPYKHADGRKKYFPTRVVGEITELLRLQEEGWKLTQIKKRLRTPAKAGQNEAPNQEQLAKLFLEDYLGNGEFRDRQRNIDGADPATPEWRKVRNFLVTRLSHFVGRKQAVRSVTSFMVGLSPREVKKLLRRANVRVTPQEQSSDSVSPARSSSKLSESLSQLREPDWSGPGPEPVLSLRIRECLSSLSTLLTGSASGREAVEDKLKKLVSLHGELKASLEFFSSKQDIK